MELTRAAPPVHPDSSASPSARELAERNLRANRAALHITQPQLEIATLSLNWTFGRDGSLTIRDFGAWWAGCSIPARAALEQLRSLDVHGPVACFLDPPHAAHLRVALEKLQPSQAIVALVPDEQTLAVILGSGNLAVPIAQHRLWFVYGNDWQQAMRRLYRERPGLTTPAQFIRLNLPDPQRLEPMIAAARQTIAEIVAARTDDARTIASTWKPVKAARSCIVTGKYFRLWADSGLALAELAARSSGVAEVLCSDDPASASTHSLLLSAIESGCLLTADIARADLPDLLPRELPWTTWVTTPRILAAHAAGPNDRLLLADPMWVGRALAAGWTKEQVAIAAWPAISTSPAASGECGGDGFVALIADTTSLEPPPRLEEFSSHRLLWNTVRDELLADPWLVTGDADAYLTARLRKFDVRDEGLDRQLFLRGLIEPAVTQGIARRLLQDGGPLRVFGHGWDQLQQFSKFSGGQVLSREHLTEVASTAAAILDPRPNPFRDQRYSLGRPVIRTTGRTSLAVRQEVALALKGQLACPPAIQPLALSMVLAD